MCAEPIYLDHHATTPVDERVFEAMRPYFSGKFGNAASRIHRFGQEAQKAVQIGRARLASLLDCKPSEVVFTSGATESDNLAIVGSARALEHRGRHIVTLQTEHRAVLDPCRSLLQNGWRVTLVDVGADGRVALDALEAAIEADTVLVSVMLANNEIGVRQDLEAIAAMTRRRDVLLHCDAAQGLGLIPLSTRELPVDLVSVSGHKMYGPKGVGALYVRDSARANGVPMAQVLGGGHENGLRSGTLNVPGIVGLGAAAEILRVEGAAEAQRTASLRDALERRLLSELEEVRVNGSQEHRHPGNLNLSFGYVDGPRLLLEICERVAVSSGAACSSAEPGPSYVLRAMGVPAAWAAASIRFGVGRGTTEEEVATTADVVIETVNRLRERSTLWARRSEGKLPDW